jgi:hypothetical protein
LSSDLLPNVSLERPTAKDAKAHLRQIAYYLLKQAASKARRWNSVRK